MIKNSFKEYVKKQETGTTKFTFTTAKSIEEIQSKNIEISAVLSFVILGDGLIVIRNKNNEWDIPGGKVDPGEDWKDAIIREIEEEAGVFINENSIEVMGYFLAENSDDNINSFFPKKNIMPVCLSFTDTVINNWKKKETLDRKLVQFKELDDYFDGKADKGQLLDISKYVKKYIDGKNIDIKFKYLQKSELTDKENNVVTTQAMAMCKKGKKYCIVRDFDESFFSIPGGGCELGETSLECIKREILEEAQFECSDYKLIGRLFVSSYCGDVLLAKVSHDRYLCSVNEVREFIPRKNGFEIEERKFMDLDGIQDQVKILQNSTGNIIIKELSE